MNMPQDQAAVAALPPELAALQAQAAQLEKDTALQDPSAPAEPAPVDHVADAREIINFVAVGASLRFPSLERTLGEAQVDKLAVAAGPLLKKYDLDIGVLLAKWGPEIGMVFALWTVGIPVAKGIKADLKTEKAEKAGAPAAIPTPAEYQAATATTAAAGLFAKA